LQTAVTGNTLMVGSCLTLPSTTHADDDHPTVTNILHPFTYSPEWTGTRLQLRSLEEALLDPSSRSVVSGRTTWPMGRWPDPILRRPCQEVDEKWLTTPALMTVAGRILTQTAEYEGAVGLAAQQCGINARMIYLQGYGVWINPRIVGRSPEAQMKVWEERCLVLPPTWTATVLRDSWIEVEYYTVDSTTSTSTTTRKKRSRLYGESSRCFQHEYDHDRGILVTDHVALDELESDTMRDMERFGHEQRQAIAYTRHLDNSLV
jgi:peptide deformylase